MPREYPHRPIPAVGAVVWNDGRVLLIRRAKPPNAGAWSLPGGAQEIGETVAETAVREVREETGTEIDVVGLVDVVDSVHRDENGRVRFHYTLIDVAARWRSGDILAGSDATDVAWVAPEDLPVLDLWDETLRIIEASRALVE